MIKATVKFADSHELRALKTLALFEKKTIFSNLKVGYDLETNKIQKDFLFEFVSSSKLICYTLEDLFFRIEKLENNRVWSQKNGKGSIQLTRAEIQALFMHFQIRNFQPYEVGIYHKLIFPLLTINL